MARNGYIRTSEALWVPQFLKLKTPPASMDDGWVKFFYKDDRSWRAIMPYRRGRTSEVLQGLRGDEIVVLAHAESLRDGETVQVLAP